MGMLCLFYRYFGHLQSAFHPTEFGIIVSLVLLNFFIAGILVSLALGLHQGEYPDPTRLNGQLSINEPTRSLQRR